MGGIAEETFFELKSYVGRKVGVFLEGFTPSPVRRLPKKGCGIDC